MATLPISSMPAMPAMPATIAPATIPLTRAQIAQARRPRGAAITARLARQHAPCAWERVALWLSLAPHRLLPSRLSCRWSAFWDTWAVAHPTNWALRPRLRQGLAIERRRVLVALRAVRRASARTSWPQTAAAADARWRAEVRDLLDTLGVVVEATTDLRGATHFSTRDLAGWSRAQRAALTQPSLDALLLAGDDPADSMSLTRPHDASTQPALPSVRRTAR